MNRPALQSKRVGVSRMAFRASKVFGTFEKRAPGVRFSKVPKLYGHEKPFVKHLRAYSVKLVVSNVVKGIQIKITAKFRAPRRLRFEYKKGIMSPEKFRDFRETGSKSKKLSDSVIQIALH